MWWNGNYWFRSIEREKIKIKADSESEMIVDLESYVVSKKLFIVPCYRGFWRQSAEVK